MSEQHEKTTRRTRHHAAIEAVDAAIESAAIESAAIENGEDANAHLEEIWRAFAIAGGHTVWRGQVLLALSGDVGNGYFVPFPVPAGFGALQTDGQRSAMFRAFAGFALRAGQGAIKAAEKNSGATRETCYAAGAGAVKAVCAGTYNGDEKSKDRLRSVAMDRMRAMATRQNPNAAKADIETLCENSLPAYLEKFGDKIVAEGFPVTRKAKASGTPVAGKPSKPSLALSFDDIAGEDAGEDAGDNR